MHPRPNVHARPVFSSLAVFFVFFFSLSVSLSVLALNAFALNVFHLRPCIPFCSRGDVADARARTHMQTPMEHCMPSPTTMKSKKVTQSSATGPEEHHRAKRYAQFTFDFAPRVGNRILTQEKDRASFVHPSVFGRKFHLQHRFSVWNSYSRRTFLPG